MFLGHIPENVKIHENAGHVYGFKGCIRELQVNNKEFFIIDEALRGKNIENCHVPQRVHHLCHNNGTCVRLVLASWSPTYIAWLQILKITKPPAPSSGWQKKTPGISKFLCASPRWCTHWWLILVYSKKFMYCGSIWHEIPDLCK